ncbi:hypothetical protein [Paenibacillus daejeonensis]|uniref:hypothetical protein n=1 Tax=Paenibacillus daejeonensis TaxID=135193 RepID=UPI00036D02E5|nr:hypothetical protein [Paenibacillus daejeonensis]
MTTNLLTDMSTSERYLVEQAMTWMDGHYDPEAAMIGEGGARHGTRESAHYALGLLLRGAPGDAETAHRVIARVLDMQIVAQNELYDGTFRKSPDAPLPPSGHSAWGRFSPGFGYANSDALDEVYRRFVAYGGLLGEGAGVDRGAGSGAAGARATGETGIDSPGSEAVGRAAPPPSAGPLESGGPASQGAGSGTLAVQATGVAELARTVGRDPLFALFRRAVDEVYPRVWRSFDPNWREFIACTFAMILEHFESQLPSSLVERMDEAMTRTVAASLERFVSQSIPTNTNIELMHLFATHYYGHRYSRADWITHAEQASAALLEEYSAFHSFAEFNSSTYYGVDLTVLGMWRRYGRSDSFRETGRVLEHGLWEDIAEFYEPSLENLCGPYARSYENEITEHSSIGVLLYLALGPEYNHLTGINCETSHDPMIALVGVDMPEAVRQQLRTSRGERFAYRQFNELCERDLPPHNRNVCTARAWISPELMIGGLSGSRNTNGQMHNATAHWQGPDGRRYSLRMVRREVGQTWNSHLRGMAFRVETSERQLDITAELHCPVPIELVFELGVSAPEVTGAWGTAAQGATAQGTAAQGATVQGATVQGATAQGATAQGTAAQGATAQGATVQGATVQGTAAQGTAAQGTAAQGATAQGATAQGLLSEATVTPGRWELPGLTIDVTANAPEPVLAQHGSKLEIIYPVHTHDHTWELMQFQLRFMKH